MAKEKKPQNRGLFTAACLGGVLVFAYTAMTQWPSATPPLKEPALDRFEHLSAAANVISEFSSPERRQSQERPNAIAAPSSETTLTAGLHVPLPAQTVDPLDVQTRAYASKGAVVGRPTHMTSNSLVVDGRRFLLHGILVPNPDVPCVTTGQQWSCGTESGKALKQLVGSHEVACIAMGYNEVGYSVARCYVGQKNLAASMVNAGWALADERITRDYVSQQIDARAYKKGFWSSQFNRDTFIGAYQ